MIPIYWDFALPEDESKKLINRVQELSDILFKKYLIDLRNFNSITFTTDCNTIIKQMFNYDPEENLGKTTSGNLINLSELNIEPKMYIILNYLEFLKNPYILLHELMHADDFNKLYNWYCINVSCYK